MVAFDIKDVVLVHGLWFRVSFMRVLARRMQSAGYRVRGFDYRSTQIPLEKSAQRLQTLCERDYPEGVHLVGHSLGGLLILQMLENGAWDKPGRILFLGTPLKGSAVARRAAQWPGAAWLFGHARDRLWHGHPGFPEERVTGMIAGTRARGLGRLTGGLQSPNDGTVAVVETRHPDLTERVELPVSHTGMLYSPLVARQATHFLSRGRFSPVTISA